ncbi:MAG: nucleoside-diphosphate sugar epimerase/dehydratase [Actinomycetota bacterium]
MVALPVTSLLRYDLEVSALNLRRIALAWVIAATSQGVIGWSVGLYRRRWRYGTFEEAIAVSATVGLAGCVLWMLALLAPGSFGARSVPPLATVFTIAGALSMRSMWRLYWDRRSKPVGALGMVVVGAGSGGNQIVRDLLSDSHSPYIPVAVVDDDPMKAHLRLQGVRVLGTVDDLVEVAKGQQVRHVLMAVPSADSQFVRRVVDLCRDGGLTLLVLPSVAEVFGAPVGRDIRPVAATDLLGRAEAIIDPAAVSAYVRGRRVLVTGAGGSIGSELCRQLAKYEPAALVMLDRDESALQNLQLSLDGRGLLDDPNLVLADIRDRARMIEVFSHHLPEVVFHAAALKHLPLLETAPEEAWKTNVVGTQHVLDAALAVGVQYFVNISTDKAANPISVLGFSKRLTERLTAAAAQFTSGMYVSVRFGNVLGSRGSVLATFRTQASTGGPITVTHPDVTRFFMSIEEAVRLTKYAAAIGTSGEVMVLNMGTPVRNVGDAHRFANQHDPPLPVVFTGLRPGEKVHEDLFDDGERGDCRVHPLITHVIVTPLQYEHLIDVVADRGAITLDLLAEAAYYAILKVPEAR